MESSRQTNYCCYNTVLTYPNTYSFYILILKKISSALKNYLLTCYFWCRSTCDANNDNKSSGYGLGGRMWLCFALGPYPCHHLPFLLFIAFIIVKIYWLQLNYIFIKNNKWFNKQRSVIIRCILLTFALYHNHYQIILLQVQCWLWRLRRTVRRCSGCLRCLRLWGGVSRPTTRSWV